MCRVKEGTVRHLLILCVGLGCLWHAGIVAQAYLCPDSPYVSVAPDGKAWTMHRGDRKISNVAKGKMVGTGVSQQLAELKTGEHYYIYKRCGQVPVGYWKCVWQTGQCIHNVYTSEPEYHGLTFRTAICGKKYYSGWNAYCADCKEPVTDIFFYLSMEGVKSLRSLPMGIGSSYFYLCPHCNNLEQGAVLEGHSCKAISANRYKVHYEPNFTGKVYGAEGGYMEDSVHMYGDALQYEGKAVVPQKNLYVNSYYRTGYVFTGWNTKADGSGRHFTDGQRISNLSTENWSTTGDEDSGMVTLYAQWKLCKSTLRIQPAGGSYEGSREPVERKGYYLQPLQLDDRKVVPPTGPVITFDTNGGTAVRPMQEEMYLTGWHLEGRHSGRMKEADVYEYGAVDAVTDVVTATYGIRPVTLPSVKKSGYSFGGWYLDEKCTLPAGAAGEEYMAAEDTRLYASWVKLTLESSNNKKAYQGTGAVDLNWHQADTADKTFLVYQSKDGRNFYRIYRADESGDTEVIRAEFPYQEMTRQYRIPYTGIWKISAAGAAGESFENRKGGKGGETKAHFWLEAGDVITVKTGGKNGYNGGGKGTIFGGGGGYTSVVSRRLGTLLLAGGGGGGSKAGNGKGGGPEPALAESGSLTGVRGKKGKAGGGGGYQAGAADTYLVHSHDKECYVEENGQYVADDRFYRSHNGGQAVGTGAYPVTITTDESRIAIGSHKLADPTILSLLVGKENPLKTPESGFLTFVTRYEGEGAQNDRFQIGTRVHMIHTDGSETSKGYEPGKLQLVLQKSENVKVTARADDGTLGSTYVERKTYRFSADWCQGSYSYAPAVTWKQNDHYYGYVAQVSWECRYHIPVSKAIRAVYLEQTGSFQTEGWIGHSISDVKYAYSVEKHICGYSQGQVIESRPAEGGASYINQEEALWWKQQDAACPGDGQAEISAVIVGFTEELSLKAVAARDESPPKKLQKDEIQISVSEDNMLWVRWQAAEDAGSVYYHKVESYRKGSDIRLCQSNITANMVISGIAGYRYCISSKKQAGQKLTAETDRKELRIPIKETVQYLHLAAVDKAGNLGEAVVLELDPRKLPWPVETKSLCLTTLEEGEVTPNAKEKEPGIWYVRSDGKTPFYLKYTGIMKGMPQTDYQITRGGFHMQSGALYLRIPPENNPWREGLIDVEKAVWETEGSFLPERYSGSRIMRSENGRVLQIQQGFLPSMKLHDTTMTIYPSVAVVDSFGTKRAVTSNQEADRKNGLKLIFDGAGPDILGTEWLMAGKWDSEPAETFALQIAARDSISGVDRLTVELKNLQNGSRRTYVSKGEAISLCYQADDPLYDGEFVVSVTAVDCVGNVTTQEKSVCGMRLTVRVKRLLSPHNPIFKRGESGELEIQFSGRADYVEIAYPQALKEKMEIWHPETQQNADRRIRFMIPLDAEKQEEYWFVVRAYRGEYCLEERARIWIIEGGESVLSEIRTRIR